MDNLLTSLVGLDNIMIISIVTRIISTISYFQALLYFCQWWYKVTFLSGLEGSLLMSA